MFYHYFQVIDFEPAKKHLFSSNRTVAVIGYKRLALLLVGVYGCFTFSQRSAVWPVRGAVDILSGYCDAKAVYEVNCRVLKYKT